MKTVGVLHDMSPVCHPRSHGTPWLTVPPTPVQKEEVRPSTQCRRVSEPGPALHTDRQTIFFRAPSAISYLALALLPYLRYFWHSERFLAERLGASRELRAPDALHWTPCPLSSCLDVSRKRKRPATPCWFSEGHLPREESSGHKSYRWTGSVSPGPAEGRKGGTTAPEQVHLRGCGKASGSSRWVHPGQGESHWDLLYGLSNSGH